MNIAEDHSSTKEEAKDEGIEYINKDEQVEVNSVIAVIGPKWVGKTSFIRRFIFNEFK